MKSAAGKFPKLLEPGVIQGVQLKNRVVSAPLGSEFCTRDGLVTGRMMRYYEEKAKGGTGLIIVEYAHIDTKASMAIECQLGIYDNACIAGHSRLSEVMQDHGAKTCLQIVHSGATKYTTAFPAVAPSAAPFKKMKVKGKELVMPKELTSKEIHGIVVAFGDAAARAKQAGYDMVEIHGAHGYLITEFLSPLTNQRKDMYGGNQKKRMRFVLDVVEEVKKRVGNKYPVGIRLSGSEYQKGGIEIEDTVALCKELDRLDMAYIHLSGGNVITLQAQVVPSCMPLAFNVWAAEAVKKVVRVPVIASGSLTSPELAEEVLRDGKADYVGLGRPLLADPYFVKKTMEGKTEDIRPCIRCNVGCLTRGTVEKRGLMCSVNVAMGREERLGKLQYEGNDPAPQSKKVFVVGGGPGGMEAARVAALRGHQVTLFEKRDQLGGALIEASLPKFKADLLPLITYLTTQLKKLGVKIHTGKNVTVEELVQGAPDAVIVATGGKPFVIEVPGLNKPHVVHGLDVLRGKEVGKNVIIIGGNQTGVEIAKFLIDKGKTVAITTLEDEIGMNVEAIHLIAHMEEFEKAKVAMYTNVALKEITNEGVVMTHKTGKKITLKGDNVILALGFAPDKDMQKALAGKGLQVFPLGDCVLPRKIHDAMYEGHIVGRMIGSSAT